LIVAALLPVPVATGGILGKLPGIADGVTLGNLSIGTGCTASLTSL
jgi:hypothetical protein